MKNIWNDPRSLFNGNHFSSIYISREISIEHPTVGLASLAQLLASEASLSQIS